MHCQVPKNYYKKTEDYLNTTIINTLQNENKKCENYKNNNVLKAIESNSEPIYWTHNEL